MKFKGKYPVYRNKIHYREMQKNRTLDEFDILRNDSSNHFWDTKNSIKEFFSEDDKNMEREEE